MNLRTASLCKARLQPSQGHLLTGGRMNFYISPPGGALRAHINTKEGIKEIKVTEQYESLLLNI